MTIHPLTKLAPGDTTGEAEALSCQDGTAYANKLKIKSHPDNEGYIYVGTSVDMDPDTGEDIVDVLHPSGETVLGDERDGNVLKLTNLFVLATNATDYVLGLAVTR
jgi:hypothetical protein